VRGASINLEQVFHQNGWGVPYGAMEPNPIVPLALRLSSRSFRSNWWFRCLKLSRWNRVRVSVFLALPRTVLCMWLVRQAGGRFWCKERPGQSAFAHFNWHAVQELA
jgi:hypothetical protein